MDKRHGNRRNRQAWRYLTRWTFSGPKEKQAVEVEMARFVSDELRSRFLGREPCREQTQ